jgi:hypothetical protein
LSTPAEGRERVVILRVKFNRIPERLLASREYLEFPIVIECLDVHDVKREGLPGLAEDGCPRFTRAMAKDPPSSAGIGVVSMTGLNTVS